MVKSTWFGFLDVTNPTSYEIFSTDRLNFTEPYGTIQRTVFARLRKASRRSRLSPVSTNSRQDPLMARQSVSVRSQQFASSLTDVSAHGFRSHRAVRDGDEIRRNQSSKIFYRHYHQLPLLSQIQVGYKINILECRIWS